MAARTINEPIEFPEQPWRDDEGRSSGWRRGRSVLLSLVLILLSGGSVYVLMEARLRARSVPPVAEEAIDPTVQKIEAMEPALQKIEAVQPALQQINARVEEALQRIDMIDRNVRASLETIAGEPGGRPETDGAAAEENRPWVLRGEGLQDIDSRDPATSQATEIHVATSLSEEQIEALATEIDGQFGPKLDSLVAKVDSGLDEKFREIARRHQLTDAQLVSLKAELTQSMDVFLREEAHRNEQLAEENARYRVLFEKSLTLSQDLIALYAGRIRNDHALGNVLKVVPKLFTLQVWENRDNKNQYLQLLERFRELSEAHPEASGQPQSMN